MLGVGQRHVVAGVVRGVVAVLVVGGVGVGFEPALGQVDDPDLRDAGLGVARKLGLAVVGVGRVGDLDDEQGIGGDGHARLGGGAQKRHVRLRLLVRAELHRVLDADFYVFSNMLHEKLRETIYAEQMRSSDGRHRANLAVDEFDAVVGAEDARLGHRAVVVGGEEEPIGGDRGHGGIQIGDCGFDDRQRSFRLLCV
jgi:hypothetical protein